MRPRLPITLGLPLKATPENLVPRKLMSYMQMQMHIESKVKISSISSLTTSTIHADTAPIDRLRKVP